jgi:hypothetical protein
MPAATTFWVPPQDDSEVRLLSDNYDEVLTELSENFEASGAKKNRGARVDFLAGYNWVMLHANDLKR